MAYGIVELPGQTNPEELTWPCREFIRALPKKKTPL
jgi:hypothetical protein